MTDETLALDLELFDTTKNRYVPEQPKKKKIQMPKLLEQKLPSPQQSAGEAKRSALAAVKASVFALVMLVVLGSLIYSSVVLTNLKADLAKANSQLKTSQSENIALQMKFNSMMSMDKIEEYAQSNLGMVKRENYQIRYFDISNDGGAELTKSGKVNG